MKKRKRHALMQNPFPVIWDEILNRTDRLYHILPPELKDRLQGLIQVFIAEKNFEGCGGLEITEEIKITIAAEACILILNLEADPYTELSTILVYPHAFVSRLNVAEEGYHINKEVVRIGESSQQGFVVLAWDHIKKGSLNIQDGENVTLHEFAHQLDQEGGPADGLPLLGAGLSVKSWSKILGREFEDLQQKTENGIKTIINQYGATNPAEFFAVVTETFFEKPKQLHKKHPELYEELKKYYGLDPEKWR